MKNKAVLKVLSIIGNVLMYLFFAACLTLLVITVTARKNKDGTPIVFGREIRLVLTNSMEKCDQTDVSNYEIKDLPVHSAVFVEVVPTDPEKAKEWYASLKVGDVLTFKYVYVEQVTITHRLVEIEPKEDGGYILTLEGDNKASDSEVLRQVIDTSKPESFNYVIGKATGRSIVLGFLIYALQQPVGIVCIVIVPCAIIAVLEVIRIIDAINKNKKKKIEEEASKKESEIEELKRRLAELEAKKDHNGTDSENIDTQDEKKEDIIDAKSHESHRNDGHEDIENTLGGN